MVYIYKKNVGSKTYYYLRASLRKGARVGVKDIAYLGINSEEAQKALERLPKYAADIRKAYNSIHNFLRFNYYLEKVKTAKLKANPFLQEKLAEIEACKLHYSTVFKKEPLQTQQEILKNFVIEFSFNTASLEGNTISLEEARHLLQEGKTPAEKTLREIYDLQNTERVFFQLFEKRKGLDHHLIQKIHQELMKDIDPRAGYRSTDVRVLRSHFDSSPAPYVFTDMKLLLQWYEKNKNILHPLVLAILFHHKFEKIHPFMDGNGRTGRILFNYICLSHAYPPVIIRKKTRDKYLLVLHKADAEPLFPAENSLTAYLPLVRYVAEELNETYWSIFL